MIFWDFRDILRYLEDLWGFLDDLQDFSRWIFQLLMNE